ncbi:hypothetical protein ABZ826_27755 [Streptomyces sp. NPDC047515]
MPSGDDAALVPRREDGGGHEDGPGVGARQQDARLPSVVRRSTAQMT